MRVGLAGFRPCIRFHSSCVTSAIAYAVSAFSFVSIRFFYIAVTLFCCLFFRPAWWRLLERCTVLRSRYSTYLSCVAWDRHVPKRNIIHTFVLQRNGDFIYLLLSVECFNRWWIIFNGNVLGTELPHTLFWLRGWRCAIPHLALEGYGHGNITKTPPSSWNDVMKKTKYILGNDQLQSTQGQQPTYLSRGKRKCAMGNRIVNRNHAFARHPTLV